MSVDVNGDTLDEADETFTVDLSNPANATIDDGEGVGTITDDDPPPAVSIDDATRHRGEHGHRHRDLHGHARGASGRR